MEIKPEMKDDKIIRKLEEIKAGIEIVIDGLKKIEKL